MFVKYDQLECYKRAYAMILALHPVTHLFPKVEQYGGFADQMRRASRGICANMAEGLSKRMSSAEERRFLSMAMGSCEEMRVWFSLSKDLGFLDATRAEAWSDEYDAIKRMIYSLWKKREE